MCYLEDPRTCPTLSHNRIRPSCQHLSVLHLCVLWCTWGSSYKSASPGPGFVILLGVQKYKMREGKVDLFSIHGSIIYERWWRNSPWCMVIVKEIPLPMLSTYPQFKTCVIFIGQIEFTIKNWLPLYHRLVPLYLTPQKIEENNRCIYVNLSAFTIPYP